MGGTEVGKLTFSAGLGGAAGLTIGRMLGKFAGCLIVIVALFVIALLIGVFGRLSSSPLSGNGRASMSDSESRPPCREVRTEPAIAPGPMNNNSGCLSYWPSATKWRFPGRIGC